MELKLETVASEEFKAQARKAMQEIFDENMAELQKSIRRECADRAESWYLQGVADHSKGEYAEEVKALRAAIEGGQE